MLMRSEQQQAAAIGLLTTICILNLRTEASNTGSKAVTTFCTEKAYAQAILQQLSQWQITSATAAKEQTEEHSLLELAAARYATTTHGPGYQALAALARKIAADATATTLRAAAAVDEAQTLLSARLAELSVVEALNRGQITAGTAGTRAATALGVLNSGQAQHCKTTGSITLAETVNCASEEAAMNHAKQVEAEMTQLQNLKIRTPADLRTVTINIGMEVEGTVNAAGGNYVDLAGAAGCGASGASPTNAGVNNGFATKLSLPKVNFAPGDLKIQPETSTASKQKASADLSNVALHTADTDMQNAMQKAVAAKPQIQKKVSERTLSALISETAITDFAERQAMATSKAKTQPLKPAEVAKLLFGVEQTDAKAVFIDKLSTDTTTITNGEQKIEGTTADLSKNNFAKAVAYFYAKNKKTLAAIAAAATPEEKAKADATEKAEEKKDGDNKASTECKATEEKDCDKNKCEWNAEKKQCKVKEGAVIIFDVMKVPLLEVCKSNGPTPPLSLLSILYFYICVEKLLRKKVFKR
uniref:Variant surface glycoprotein 1125.3053 n=1 Tax=Trypanosoma brucei TaxID=5691 RepID=A0A1J0R9F5_9TRYP|nr:variant surface glycoprotein 1125.3053 [Trypanosoma brucei]